MRTEEKIEVRSQARYLLLHPRHTVLVTCVDGEGRPNIITLAWTTPVSFDPPLVAISVGPERYSHDLIRGGGDFVINVPEMELAKETLYCGRNSGRDVDKFRETGLTPLPAKKVRSPLIQECTAHLECRVVDSIPAGDHTLFLGEVVHATVREGVFKERFDAGKIEPIFHLGGDDFVTLEK
jgi:flavin reductase (DIM6/NTAB) family NADH-FMN oxidoreductase RutF